MPSLSLPRRQTIKSTRNDLYIRLKDVYIPTRDGGELCADIFLPFSTDQDVKVPALLSMCPYGKDVHALEWGLPQTDMYAKMNAKIKPLGPDAALEALDPLVWCKDFGYAVVRIDCRGVGGTPGTLDPWGLQRSVELGDDAEGNDLYDAIEWTARQPWCTGNVGMSGISYLGMVAWLAAQKNPPSLKAIIPWESGNDLLSQTFRPGGLQNAGFLTHWWKNCVLPYQHGRAEGVSETELAASRVDFLKTLDCEFRKDGPFAVLARSRGLDKVRVPLYSAANWMDTEVHSPGNILGYLWASSEIKYLETHAGDHINAYYGPEAISRQRQFLDCFLKNEGSSLDEIPKVDLTIRKGATTFRRVEEDFPPRDTQYREYFLTLEGTLELQTLSSSETIVAEYDGLQGSKIFTTAPLSTDFELLGFPYLVLDVATEAKDMDIFVTITNIALDGKPVEFEGNHGEPSVSVGRGYIRLSHRELDSQTSKERLVILKQQEPAPVEPGQRYVVKMPVQPTSMVFEKGHRIQVELGGKDSETLLGVMRHEGSDRTVERFGGKNTFFGSCKIVLPFVERGGP